MPLISIIIPVYNVEKYLRECLDSIIQQTFQNFEVICVDDGSTDNSLEILESYKAKDNRFKILTQQNSGAGIARNNGIKVSTGQYIQFLDSDDYFEPNLLEKMYHQVEKYNADLVICSYRKVDDNGTITESRNPNSPINLDKVPLNIPFNKNDFPNEIFSLLAPVPWNKLYRKNLIVNNNITFPNLRICEDLVFVYSCIAVANTIVVFDDELINYRFNRPASMATCRQKYSTDVIHACNTLKQFLIDKNLYDDLKEAYINTCKTHIHWNTIQYTDVEYNNFLEQLKTLMPNEWKNLKNIANRISITYDYLNKLIGDSKVMLWGASFFLQNLLSKEDKKNENIIGVIDKNSASWGKMCGNYKVYPPESLLTLKPDKVIMTILSNNEIIYPILKQEFMDKYPNIELVSNIFE